MSVLEKLSSSINHRGTAPNIELAVYIVQQNDTEAVRELVEQLKNKKIQSDCIKVLYEIGERNPSLISSYATQFLELLSSKNNRMVWGTMCALDMITLENKDLLFNNLPLILDVAAKGTVITKDHAVGIMTKLGTVDKYNDSVVALLLEQLIVSLPNQFPTYAEKTATIIKPQQKEKFINILNQRLKNIDTDTRRKRVEKIIKKLDK